MVKNLFYYYKVTFIIKYDFEFINRILKIHFEIFKKNINNNQSMSLLTT